MNIKLLLLSSLVALGCGGSTAPTPKPVPKLDPYLTIRVRDQLDTTTVNGRSGWRLYLLLTSPQSPGQEGINHFGSITLDDVRGNRNVLCAKAGSDSLGNRFVSLLAIADTLTQQMGPDAAADSIAAAWFNGNHTLPAGWKALVVPPVDAWDSQQFAAGHGQTREDPVRWGWDWSGQGATSFYERQANDVASCNTY